MINIPTISGILVITVIELFCMFLVLKYDLSEIKNKKKYWISLATILSIATAIYFMIFGNRVFFSYDETDMKYFMNIIKDAKTNVKFEGYLSLFVILEKAIRTPSPIQLFHFVKWLNLFLILTMFFLVYTLFHRKTSDFKATVLTISLMLYPPLLLSIWYYKSIYLLTLICVFVSYYLFVNISESIKQRDSKRFWLNFIAFSINFSMSIHVREEYLFFVLPMLLYSIPDLIKFIRKRSTKEKVAFESVVIIFFFLLSINAYNWFFQLEITRTKQGSMNIIYSEYLHMPSLDVIPFWDAFSFAILFILLIFRDTRLFGITWIFEFGYIKYFTLFWDQILFPMYFTFALFLVAIHLTKKKYFVIAILFMILCFYYILSPSMKQELMNNGKSILTLHNYLKNKEFTIYDYWPSIYSAYVFSDTKCTFKGYMRYFREHNIPTNAEIISVNTSCDKFLKSLNITDLNTTYFVANGFKMWKMKDCNISFKKAIDYDQQYTLYTISVHR